jgi:hypothetical protein
MLVVHMTAKKTFDRRWWYMPGIPALEAEAVGS